MPASAGMATMRAMPASEHRIQREEFFAKNTRLDRPVSPHLTIYKPQLTSMLSITHRGTGCFQSALLSGFAVTGEGVEFLLVKEIFCQFAKACHRS